MSSAPWIVCLALFWTSTGAAQTRGLLEAERAYQAVDFPATHSLAQQALESGGKAREETARLYVLLGISAAALGDSDEAKRDFSVALAVAPGLKLDKSLSPKIRGPYLEAQGYWALSPARLSLLANATNHATELAVRLIDPSELVAEIELRIGAPNLGERARLRRPAARVTRFAVPADVAGRRYEYSLRALDRYGNILCEYDAQATPRLSPEAHAVGVSKGDPREPAAPHSRLLPAALALGGVGALASGVVFHVKREQAAHEWNGPSCENPGRTRIAQCEDVNRQRSRDELWAISSYAVSGALLSASLIALVAGSPAASHAALGRPGFGCTPLGAGVTCEGRF